MGAKTPDDVRPAPKTYECPLCKRQAATLVPCKVRAFVSHCPHPGWLTRSSAPWCCSGCNQIAAEEAEAEYRARLENTLSEILVGLSGEHVWVSGWSGLQKCTRCGCGKTPQLGTYTGYTEPPCIPQLADRPAASASSGSGDASPAT